MESSCKKYYICVTPFFPTQGNWRGAYVLDQVKAIQRNSDYEVIVMKPTGPRDRLHCYVLENITVYEFPVILSPSYIFNGILNAVSNKMFLNAIRKIGVAAEDVAVIHTHTGPFATFALALKNKNQDIKTLVQHHDLDPFTLRNGKFAMWRPNARYRAKNSIRLFNAIDCHVCISEPCRDNLLSFPKARAEEVYESYLRCMDNVTGLPSITPKSLYVLNNGVDINLFKPSQIKNNQEKFTIGCIGNFEELKGHIFLIKAIEELVTEGHTDIELKLIGSGPLRHSIEDYVAVKNLSVYVHWLPEMRHEQLPSFFHQLDLFVLPSFFEGFGCVYTEAAAAGIPFICCEHQGAAECIALDETSRWTVKPFDSHDIATKILKYKTTRTHQNLRKDLSIDKLIVDFLTFIDKYV